MNSLVAKRSLADEVVDKLKKQIINGQYQVNEKLPIEPELMKTFGVGRSTIRDAVKNLVQSGFLRVQQGAGTFVEKVVVESEPIDERLKRANVQDLDEVRQLIEMKIAEKAAINRSQFDIATMKLHLENRKKAADANLIEECIDADVNFHMAVAVASKNEILADLYKVTSVHLKKWFMQIYPDTLIFKETQYLHEKLFKAILACDSKEAWNTAANIIGRIYQ